MKKNLKKINSKKNKNYFYYDFVKENSKIEIFIYILLNKLI